MNGGPAAGVTSDTTFALLKPRVMGAPAVVSFWEPCMCGTGTPRGFGCRRLTAGGTISGGDEAGQVPLGWRLPGRDGGRRGLHRSAWPTDGPTPPLAARWRHGKAESVLDVGRHSRRRRGARPNPRRPASRDLHTLAPRSKGSRSGRGRHDRPGSTTRGLLRVDPDARRARSRPGLLRRGGTESRTVSRRHWSCWATSTRALPRRRDDRRRRRVGGGKTGAARGHPFGPSTPTRPPGASAAGACRHGPGGPVEACRAGD